MSISYLCHPHLNKKHNLNIQNATEIQPTLICLDKIVTQRTDK